MAQTGQSEAIHSPEACASTVVRLTMPAVWSMAVVCTVAVGLASLTASRPGALVALIGWQLVASPILTNISSLGSARDLVLREAVDHFSPISLGDRGGRVSMGLATALIVMVVWLVVFAALGAWRTREMDA